MEEQEYQAKKDRLCQVMQAILDKMPGPWAGMLRTSCQLWLDKLDPASLDELVNTIKTLIIYVETGDEIGTGTG